VDATEATRQVRALFISDVHPSSRACKAEPSRKVSDARITEADAI